MIIKIIFLNIAIMILWGCATIYSGTTQDINVQALDLINNQPLNDVSCMLTNINGNHYYLSKNPGTVTVPKVSGMLKANCIKEDYIQINFDAKNNFNYATLGNLLFWPSFIVDALSDSINKYPSIITVYMDVKR